MWLRHLVDYLLVRLTDRLRRALVVIGEEVRGAMDVGIGGVDGWPGGRSRVQAAGEQALQADKLFTGRRD